MSTNSNIIVTIHQFIENIKILRLGFPKKLMGNVRKENKKRKSKRKKKKRKIKKDLNSKNYLYIFLQMHCTYFPVLYKRLNNLKIYKKF